jgi:hypothetical protein
MAGSDAFKDYSAEAVECVIALRGDRRLFRHALSPVVRFGSMLSKKDFGGAGPTTLIQDQDQKRDLDSRIYLLGFVRFNFSFHSSNAATFSTVSVIRVDSGLLAFGGIADINSRGKSRWAKT